MYGYFVTIQFKNAGVCDVHVDELAWEVHSLCHNFVDSSKERLDGLIDLRLVSDVDLGNREQQNDVCKQQTHNTQFKFSISIASVM